MVLYEFPLGIWHLTLTPYNGDISIESQALPGTFGSYFEGKTMDWFQYRDGQLHCEDVNIDTVIC